MSTMWSRHTYKDTVNLFSSYPSTHFSYQEQYRLPSTRVDKSSDNYRYLLVVNPWLMSPIRSMFIHVELRWRSFMYHIMTLPIGTLQMRQLVQTRPTDWDEENRRFLCCIHPFLDYVKLGPDGVAVIIIVLSYTLDIIIYCPNNTVHAIALLLSSQSWPDGESP